MSLRQYLDYSRKKEEKEDANNNDECSLSTLSEEIEERLNKLKEITIIFNIFSLYNNRDISAKIIIKLNKIRAIGLLSPPSAKNPIIYLKNKIKSNISIIASLFSFIFSSIKNIN